MQYDGEVVRWQLMDLFDVHTLLRFLRGIFPGLGVKASVLLFDRKPIPGRPLTKKLWVYILRAAARSHPKSFDDFIACYGAWEKEARVETRNSVPRTFEDPVGTEEISLDIGIL